MEVKERPILFSAPMVLATLDGRKTQTRRVMKPQPKDGYWVSGPKEIASRLLPHWLMQCPYGQPGDRLWVRETWQQVHECQVAEGRFSKEGEAGIPGPPLLKYRVIYRADGDAWLPLHHMEGFPYRAVGESSDEAEREFLAETDNRVCWTPSIHMPRWASRITLEIVSVRVERLQEISEDDAKAEGIEIYQAVRGIYKSETGLLFKEAYARLWDSLNAKRGYGWDVNPWVWVIEFKRLTP